MAGLLLEFTVDSKGAVNSIKSLDKELLKVDKTTKQTAKSNKSLDTSYAKIAIVVGTALVGYKALNVTYSALIKNGLDYNRVIEEQEQGLKSIIVATSSNTSELGKALTLQQKYNLAQVESTKTLKQLQVLNAQTPQTLSETVKVYKSLLPSFKQAGASQKELLTITKTLAVASASAGIEFNSLLAGVDGLASGTVLANSDLGRFLNTIGLSNDELKNSEDVTQLVIDRLKDFDVAIDTLTVAESNFLVKWNEISGAVTQDVFKAQKESLKQVTKLLDDITKDEEFVDSLRNSINGITTTGVQAVEALIIGVQGARKIALTIGNIYDTVLGSFEIGLLSVKKQILEFAKEAKLVFVETFGFEGAKTLGIDTNFTKITQELAQIDSEIYKATASLQKQTQEYNNQINAIDKQSGLVIAVSENIQDNILNYKEEKKIIDATNDSLKTKENSTKTVTKEQQNLIDERVKFLAELQDLGSTSAEIEKQRLVEQFEANEQYVIQSEELYSNYTNKIIELDKKIAEEHKASQDKKTLQEGTFTEGALIGMERYKESALTTAEAGEKAFDSFAKNSEDALVDFATTGKASFGDFARSVIADLTRIIIKQAVSGLFGGGGSSGGGGGFSFGSLFQAYNGGHIPEYATGGYTGNGGKYEPKGVVHGGEYVFTKEQTNRIGLGNLEGIAKGYETGGFVSNSTTSNSGMPNIIINNNTGSEARAEARQGENGQIELFIELVEEKLSSGIIQGNGTLSETLENIFPSLERGR